MKLLSVSVCILFVSGLLSAQSSSQYCMTVRDEQGAIIPHAKVSFSPTKASRPRAKYHLVTDDNGGLTVEVLDGIYDIEVKAPSFRSLKLRNHLLPYDPRSCITVTLRSAIPPHQIT